MSLPNEAEVFTQIIYHVRKAQEACATLAHLRRDADKKNALGFLAMSEMFKLLVVKITELATGKKSGVEWNPPKELIRD